jgi:hypothetical protein
LDRAEKPLNCAADPSFSRVSAASDLRAGASVVALTGVDAAELVSQRLSFVVSPIGSASLGAAHQTLAGAHALGACVVGAIDAHRTRSAIVRYLRTSIQTESRYGSR